MLLDRHEHTSVSYVFKRSYEGVYAKLREVLPPEEAALFASTQGRKRERIWYLEDGCIPFIRVSKDIQAQVADKLDQFKSSILPKLIADAELSGIAQDLFIIPSEEQIWVRTEPDGGFSVVLSRWGCRSAYGDRNLDPFSLVVHRPRPHHSKVIIAARFSDGEPFQGQSVFLHYNDQVKSFRTDNGGQVPLGHFKHGVQLGLSAQAETHNSAKHFHTVTVEPDKEIYELVFPYLIDLSIKVHDQKKRPVSNVKISLAQNENIATHRSNADGQIYLTYWETDPREELQLTETENPSNTQTYTLPTEGIATLTFELYRPDHGDVRVWVKDQHGESLPGYPVRLLQGEQETLHQTDEVGLINLKALEAGQELTIIDGHAVDNRLVHIVSEEGTELVLEVVITEVEPVSIKLVDHKGNPIPQAVMSFELNGAQHERILDEAGNCQLPQDIFTAGQKVPVQITIPEDSPSSSRKKNYRKSFRYKEGELSYIIRLTNRRWLWWLLLLLLLPLLLIQCEKQVTIEVIDSLDADPIPGVEVEFGYVKHSLYEEGRFFVADSLKYSATADSVGRVTFAPLYTTVYAHIFNFNSKCYAYARDTCHVSDGWTARFHSLSKDKVEQLPLSPIYIPLDFIVTDREDGEPLPHAKVLVETEINGRIQADSLQSGPDGRVFFSRLPMCGRILSMRAGKEGYYPDSILNKAIPDLAGGSVDTSRVLRLTPIKERIVFYVTNCTTGEPLPDAIATIYLTSPDGEKVSEVYSNVNGVGKGQYKEAHIIRQIRIEIKKPYYKTGEWNQGLNVQEFMELPDTVRTICLEPKDLSVEFTNIDSLTRKVLPRTINLVTVKRGSTIRRDTIWSNGNGGFSVPGLNVTDKISIISINDPAYLPNQTKIQEQGVETLLSGPSGARKIPLSPKQIELIFRTVDEGMVNLVDQVKLRVLVDGRHVPGLTNSNSGMFTVKAYYHSVISIVAEKDGYQRNDTKINRKAFNILAEAIQTERDIPMLPPRMTQVTISIRNHNSRPDEAFKLVVNGQTLGQFHHNRSLVDVSNFNADIYEELNNEITLILINGLGSNTGARLEIAPGNYSHEFSGDDISYYFLFNHEKKVLRKR